MSTKQTTFTIQEQDFITAGAAKSTYGIKPGRLSKLVHNKQLNRYSFPLIVGYPLYAIREIEALNQNVKHCE